VTYLIDGYNLMHAAGLARAGMPAGALRQARTRFLNWLADAVRDRTATLRVVFDAAAAAADGLETDHRGVLVRFAGGQTADDEIEALLAHDPRPGRITVVSNDGRVREAARRRGALFQTCEEFTDWAIDPRPAPPSPDEPEPDKPEPDATAAEMAAWLAAFSQPRPRPKRRGR